MKKILIITMLLLMTTTICSAGEVVFILPSKAEFHIDTDSIQNIKVEHWDMAKTKIKMITPTAEFNSIVYIEKDTKRWMTEYSEKKFKNGRTEIDQSKIIISNFNTYRDKEWSGWVDMVLEIAKQKETK